MKLNKKEILQIQKNNGDFLMIDEVTNVVPGKSSEGYKYLNNDWFFKFHFPGDPNMPGMLQVEALMQMASIAILTTDNNEGKILDYAIELDSNANDHHIWKVWVKDINEQSWEYYIKNWRNGGYGKNIIKIGSKVIYP